MKRRIQLALMGCLLSVAAHLYLTIHYYPIKFGFADGQSMCNLNAKFDCDAVSASAYSAFLGIPMAAWGAVFNSVLFLLILLSWLEWSDHPERFKRWTVVMAGLGAAASVVMGSIAFTMMRTYCIVCIGLYVMSFVVLASVRGLVKGPLIAKLGEDIPHLWSESRGLLLTILSVPIIAFLTHRMFTQNLGDAQIAQVVAEGVNEWKASPKMEFVAKPTLTTGPAANEAALTLSEFADFRCGHCKRASYTLHAFVKAHPEVRFEFYSFPLDGACNEKIPTSSGLSCRLAAAVYCAEKDGKGWEMHDLAYGKQDTVNGFATTQEIDALLAKEVPELGLNWESVQRCIEQPETIDAIKAQAKQGGLANVMGTPTIFANGRMLSRGSLLPVLQTVLEESKAAKN